MAMTKITSVNTDGGRKDIYFVYFHCIYDVLVLHLKISFSLGWKISLCLLFSRQKKDRGQKADPQ